MHYRWSDWCAGERGREKASERDSKYAFASTLALALDLAFTQSFTLVGQHVEIVVRSTVIGDCIATYVTTRGSEGGGGEGCPAGCEETSVYLSRHFV